MFAGGEDAVSRSDVWQPTTGTWRSLRPFEGLPQAIRLISLGDGRVLAVSTNAAERQEALPIWTEATGLWEAVPLPEGLVTSQIQQASSLTNGRMLLLTPDKSLLWDNAAEQLGRHPVRHRLESRRAHRLAAERPRDRLSRTRARPESSDVGRGAG